MTSLVESGKVNGSKRKGLQYAVFIMLHLRYSEPLISAAPDPMTTRLQEILTFMYSMQLMLNLQCPHSDCWYMLPLGFIPGSLSRGCGFQVWVSGFNISLAIVKVDAYYYFTHSPIQAEMFKSC